MRVRILGSASDGADDFQYTSSYLVNDRLAVDAGCLGLCGTPAEQARVRDVLLTHSHMDHVASLPVFLENAYDVSSGPVVVYGHPATLETLQAHVFNDLIWPDFVRLTGPDLPLIRLQRLEAEQPIELCGLTVVPVLVSHVVPTYGYIISDQNSTVVFGGDSGPTDRIWCLAHQAPKPISVVLEACFPDELKWLASVSLHLTPAMFAEEVRKMPAMTNVIATHIKARFRQQIVDELRVLGIPGLVIGRTGAEYLL